MNTSSLGAAAYKGVVTSVASGNTNLITSGAVYTKFNTLSLVQKDINSTYGKITFSRQGNIVVFYGSLTGLPSSTTITICTLPFKGYQMCNAVYNATSPYNARGDASVWLNDAGTSFILYKTASVTACYISGTYVYQS